LNTRPSADLLSVLNQFASYCRSCLLIIKRARSLTDDSPAATTLNSRETTRNILLSYQHRSLTP
jgi:hypothetical protein